MTEKELLNALRLAGVSRVESLYDGSQDEGAVEWVECFGPDDVMMPIGDEMGTAIREWMFETLEDERGGWQDNGGACGLVLIDVATGVAEFRHEWRVHVKQGFDVALTGDE